MPAPRVDMDIRLKIITPENVQVDAMVEKVTLPGASGPFVVLRNHAPLISSLRSGVIAYTAEGVASECPVRSGFVEVKDNKVTACVEIR